MRLPVDRAFSMKGFGAVVTGTLVSGEIAEGDELELLPPGLGVRVRGTQVHGNPVSRASAGQRTAVNLAGVDVASIERGMVLAPVGRLRPTQIIDVVVDMLPTASRGLRSRARVRVHIGAAEVLGRVRVLDDPGEISPGKSGFAQLRLESPVVALHGDHFIIRAYSPPATIAGGLVVDPHAVKHRGKEILNTREPLHAFIHPNRPLTLTEFVRAAGKGGRRYRDIAASTGWSDAVLSAVGLAAQGEKSIVAADGVFLTTEDFDRLGTSLLAELATQLKREPLALCVPRGTFRWKIFAHCVSEVFTSV